MEWDAGTAITAGQITTSTRKVKAIEFHARSTNSGSVVVGRSDVSSENGRELTAGESVNYAFDTGSKTGSVPFSVFYTAGEGSTDWAVVLF